METKKEQPAGWLCVNIKKRGRKADFAITWSIATV